MQVSMAHMWAGLHPPPQKKKEGSTFGCHFGCQIMKSEVSIYLGFIKLLIQILALLIKMGGSEHLK